MLAGENFQLWRSHTELKVLRCLGLIASQEISQRMIRRDDHQRCRAILDLVFVDHQFADVIGFCLRSRSLVECFVRQNHVLVFLLEMNRDMPQSRSGIRDGHFQRW